MTDQLPIEPHPISRIAFDHLVRRDAAWTLSAAGRVALRAELSALAGRGELVGALSTLASVAAFLGGKKGDAAAAIVELMLESESALKAVNGALGVRVTEKRMATVRRRSERMLGHSSLPPICDRSPPPAGAARWWAIR